MATSFDNYDITRYQSNADFGARRIFGTNGSLVSYINTGNAYPDSFVSKKTKLTNNKTQRDASGIIKCLISCGAILTSFMVVKGRFKNKKIKKVKPQQVDIQPAQKKLSEKIKGFFRKKPSIPEVSG